MTIENINHLVLKVKDIDETCNFYRNILGMEVEGSGGQRMRL